MVLDRQRKNVDPLLVVIAKRFSRISPNTLTAISVVFAFLAGLFFYSSPGEEE